MKKTDLLCLSGIIIFFSPFIMFDRLFETYMNLTINHAYIMTFVKFSILATFGEMLGLRIREGVYLKKGFGIMPRAIVWGFLGISVKMAFDIFSKGAPNMLISMGMNIPNDILLQDISPLKVFVSFTIGTTLNLFYAPILMVTHKITDEHINQTGGSLKSFFSPIHFGRHMINLNWSIQWNFVFKRTIVLFWIPAQTITFLLPEEYRILFAAFLSIILGVILAIASLKSKND